MTTWMVAAVAVRAPATLRKLWLVGFGRVPAVLPPGAADEAPASAIRSPSFAPPPRFRPPPSVRVPTPDATAGSPARIVPPVLTTTAPVARPVPPNVPPVLTVTAPVPVPDPLVWPLTSSAPA